MNNANLTSTSSIKINRPKLVWAIAICYFISVGWTLFSFALLHFGVIEVPYLKSLSSFDILFTIVISLLDIVGIIYLFLLKRTAFYLLLSALVLRILDNVYQILFRNFLEANGGPSLFTMIFSLGVSIAIIMYARKLIKTGILK